MVMQELGSTINVSNYINIGAREGRSNACIWIYLLVKEVEKKSAYTCSCYRQSHTYVCTRYLVVFN